jgi:restriction endonuclease S subunit
MKTELPRYPGYKPTESEWLGELPVDWKAIQLARINTKLTNGFVGPTRDILQEEGVRYLQSLHIKGGRIIFDTPYFVSEEWSRQHSKSVLKTGDVLIVQTGDIGQVAAVTDEFAECNCHALIIVSSKRKMIDGFFLSAVLRSHYGFHSLKSVQTGALHPHLNCTKVRDIYIPVPPLEDQRAILAFLDRESAKIDRLMEVRRKQVERLEEQRTAVIRHAVTRGLDPRVETKPSGIEWVGDVPATWDIHQLRRTTAQEVNGFWGDDPKGDGTDIACIRVADFDRQKRRIKHGEKTLRSVPETKLAKRLLNAGDLLLEKSGGGDQSPVGCVVLFEDNGPAITSNFIAKLTPRKDHDARFLCFLHQALYDAGIAMLSVKQTIGIQNLDSFWYLNEKAAFPSKIEQIEIADHIERETGRIDTLISKYESEIELLSAYRASLISHAVTGKIDVRQRLARAELEEVAAQ